MGLYPHDQLILFTESEQKCVFITPTWLNIKYKNKKQEQVESPVVKTSTSNKNVIIMNKQTQYTV